MRIVYKGNFPNCGIKQMIGGQLKIISHPARDVYTIYEQSRQFYGSINGDRPIPIFCK